jgi:pyruvate/2-oxoglutarate dehydrogenase complex dihydrolipoamide acyltransferase (E2) component
MSTDVILADEYWEDVEEGTESLIEEWHVKEGDKVSAGQKLADLVVVKTNIELTSPVDGVLEKIAIQADDTFSKGIVLATIQED